MAQAPTFMSGLTGFFGGGNQQQQNPPGGQQDGHVEDEYVEEPAEPGIGDLMGEIFTPPDEEEDDDPTPAGPVLGPDGKPLPTAQQKLAQQIQTTIAGMKTEIPADFDPSNPKHLSDLLDKSNQNTALTTIQLAFQPMQMAMEEMMSNFTKTIESKLNGFGNQQSESAVLKEIVPEVEDEKLSGLVNTLFKQAKQSKAGSASPKVAAQMVRKGLDAMGIKSTKPADPFSGSGFKVGKDALDAYAPLPTQRQANPQRRQGGGNGQ